MSFLFLIASIGFVVWIIRNIFFWVALWQQKEYRIDRLLVHINDTNQGRSIFLSPLLFVKLLLFFAYGYNLFTTGYLFPFQVLTAVVFIFEFYFVFREFYTHSIKRPVWTYKATLLVVLTTFIALFIFFSPIIFEEYFWMLLIDRLIPFLIAVFVFLLSLPTDYYQDIQIRRAVQEIRKHKKLLVIGVTGSYGKSSTKEYIAQILGHEYRVIKTKGTNNTPIAIANTILFSLKNNTQIFVVEMGAYKIGEISMLCQIVQPRIGIITAVNDQHLSLFGSLENTMKAKYELIESLPKNGIAIFNGSNENSYKLYLQTKGKKILYTKSATTGDIYAKNVVVSKTNVVFTVGLQGRVLRLKAPLIGAQSIENLLPAIYIASYLGMSDESIKTAVLNLFPLKQTMVRHEIGGVSLIDDSFNANPQSVLSAVSYAKIYDGKKIMVLSPMIELGKEGESEHYKIGFAIGEVFDYLFLTDNNFNSQILKGISDSKGKCVVKTGAVYEIFDMINKTAKKGDIVVFEGKKTNEIIEKLL